MFNWHDYNESLVRRGEVILGFDVIDKWSVDLDMMNYGKEGASFRYPDSFVFLLGYMRVYFHLPYRQTEGVVRSHAGNKVPSVPDYSTINRRVNRLDIKVNESIGSDAIVIAIDSTGIKVSNRGEWIRHKWHIRKGYLKIHVAVDIKKKKILSLETTSEEVHDGKMLEELVDDVLESNDVETVLADGSYDSNDNFWYLSQNHIKIGIKVRTNSKVRPTNSKARNLAVITQKKNLRKWKDSVSYGYRWMAETVFSCMKRMFGEHVSSVKFPNMVKEMMLKASLYNHFTDVV